MPKLFARKQFVKKEIVSVLFSEIKVKREQGGANVNKNHSE